MSQCGTERESEPVCPREGTTIPRSILHLPDSSQLFIVSRVRHQLAAAAHHIAIIRTTTQPYTGQAASVYLGEDLK